MNSLLEYVPAKEKKSSSRIVCSGVESIGECLQTSGNGCVRGNVTDGLFRRISLWLGRRQRIRRHPVGVLGTNVSTWFQLHCFRYALITCMAPFGNASLRVSGFWLR